MEEAGRVNEVLSDTHSSREVRSLKIARLEVDPLMRTARRRAPAIRMVTGAGASRGVPRRPSLQRLRSGWPAVLARQGLHVGERV